MSNLLLISYFSGSVNKSFDGLLLKRKRQIQQRAKKIGPPVRRSRLSIFASFAPSRRIFWEQKLNPIRLGLVKIRRCFKDMT